MKNCNTLPWAIPHINGLEVTELPDIDSGHQRIVSYRGKQCPQIARREERCELDTSYKGSIIDSWETYRTPIGIVQRHYWARGPGLERSGVDWCLVPAETISNLQRKFEVLSAELENVRRDLELFIS